MDGGELGVQRQGRRQVVHGAFIVPLRESGPPQLDAHGRLTGIDRPRLGEALLGVHRPGQVKVDPSRARRASGSRWGEAGARARNSRAAPDRSPVFLRMWPTIVGPAEISGRQTLGVSKAALSLVVEPRRHEQLAQLAESASARASGGPPVRSCLDEGRVCLAELLLNGRVETAQIRQGHVSSSACAPASTIPSEIEARSATRPCLILKVFTAPSALRGPFPRSACATD